MNTQRTPAYLERITAEAKHHWAYPSADGSRMIPVLLARPLGEFATQMMGDALKLCKPVPTVLERKTQRLHKSQKAIAL